MATQQTINERNEKASLKLIDIREKLLRQLKRDRIKLRPEDFVHVEDVVLGIAYEKAGAKVEPPQVTAYNRGHANWARSITLVMNRMVSNNGCPRAEHDDLCFKLAREGKKLNAIMDEVAKRYNVNLSDEGVRSAIRRRRGK